MFQRISLLLALVVFLTSCGGDAPTQTTASSSGPRPLARPDVEPSDGSAEREVEAEVEPAPTENPGCAALTDLLAGANATAFYEAEFEDAMSMTHDAFSMFGVDGVEIALDFATAYDGGDLDVIADVYQQMDDISLEPCGFPGGGAYFAVPGSVGLVKFCVVSTALLGDEPPTVDEEATEEACPVPELTYPTGLPCFDATGAEWADVATGALPWEIVDCDSGAPVRWDHATADWVEA